MCVSVDVCECGCVGVWMCGCVGVWVCGCVGVWVCVADPSRGMDRRSAILMPEAEMGGHGGAAAGVSRVTCGWVGHK